MKNYNLTAQATTNFALIFQSSIATIDSLIEQAELTGNDIDMEEYYKLDRKAKVAANIWQILHDNPNADPETVVTEESAQASTDDPSKSDKTGCNVTVSANDENKKIGSPVYSYNPNTLDIFLKDIPLIYKRHLDPWLIYILFTAVRALIPVPLEINGLLILILR